MFAKTMTLGFAHYRFPQALKCKSEPTVAHYRLHTTGKEEETVRAHMAPHWGRQGRKRNAFHARANPRARCEEECKHEGEDFRVSAPRWG